MNGGHETGHLYRALLEGIFFNLYQCYSILVKIGGEPQVIRASGGILKSAAWTQMLADIWQREIECSDMEQASILGAAALALYACGAMSRLEDFGTAEGRKVLPDSSKKDRYKRRYERYLHWYEQTI